MEKDVSSLKIFNVILCAILLITFILVIGTKLNVNAEEIEGNGNNEVLPSVSKNYLSLPQLTKLIEKEETEEKQIVYDLDYYVEQNKEQIAFYANVFDYNLDDIIYDLKTREANNPVFLSTNIGYLKDNDGNLISYNSFEYGLIEYFYSLIKTKAIQRHTSYVPYTGDSEYVESLIIHYSSIYDNVDSSTLLSIGAAESGYYKVKYMLRYNNVYGGMGSNGLIRHNNIELGILSYVRMMSKNYYGKGYTSIYSIGRIYCPTVIDGIKQASPHWINLVSTAKAKYDNYAKEVSIESIIKKTEIL